MYCTLYTLNARLFILRGRGFLDEVKLLKEICFLSLNELHVYTPRH